MLNIYVYDTATGRVLATGSYNEVGDGASARALVVGAIDAATEYAPAGVKTSRPLLTPMPTLDKTSILANGVDTATFSNVPAGTVVKVFKDNEQAPRGITTVNDGSLLLRAEVIGVYRVTFENFPARDLTLQVTAT